jgi:hypothetical protein
VDNKDLKTLLPGIEVEVAGEEMLIQPFKFTKMLKAVSIVGKLGNLIFDVVRAISVKQADLSSLEPVDLIIMAAEKGIEVPAEMKDDAEALRNLIYTHMEESGGLGITMQGNKIGLESETFEALTRLFEQGGDSIFDLVKLGAGKDQAWLENLDPAEGLEVLLAIIEVNLDFFKKRLSPMLNTKISSLMAKI